MSIYFPGSKIEQSTEMLVALGAKFTAEGQAVVRTQGNTAAGVQPSTGQATDLFVGFSLAGTSAAPFAEATYNKVETFLVPATGSVKLSLVPTTATSVGIYDQTTSAWVPVDGTTVKVTGQTVSGLTAGDTVTVTYEYTLTAVQRRVLFGDVQPGGYVGDYVQQIGVITRGTVFTSQFDASKNWAAAGGSASTQICVAANGMLTLGTPGTAPAGVAVPGAYVTQIPGAEIPFLGITFDAH